MNLEEYLNALKTADGTTFDSPLTAELGIYDNYVVCLGIDIWELTDLFLNSEKWFLLERTQNQYEKMCFHMESKAAKIKRERKEYLNFIEERGHPLQRHYTYTFHYAPRPVCCDVHGGTVINSLEYLYLVDEELKKLWPHFFDKFKSYVKFHPIAATESEAIESMNRYGESQMVQLARAVIDLAEDFIIPHKIPAGFLNSCGHGEGGRPGDYSKLVCYSPDDDARRD